MIKKFLSIMKKSILSYIVIIIVHVVFKHDISFVYSQEQIYKSVNDSTLINSSTTLIKTIRYVKQTGTGLKDGSSWANASDDLQAMINASVTGDEVWVASGTYVPKNYPVGCEGCLSDRDNSFLMKDGVSLFGGFFGNEFKKNNRNFSFNKTILSGQIGDLSNIDNCYHVLIIDKCVSGIELDGFDIQNGNANGFDYSTLNDEQIYNNYGGGIFCNNSKVTLINCKIFSNNGKNGGGVFINTGTDFNLLFTKIEYNNSEFGGGVFIINSSKVSIQNCDFVNNLSEVFGGSAFNNSSSLTINNCFFSKNKAQSGGAIYNENISSCIISNCLFKGNIAKEYGGAVYNNNYSNPLIINSTIVSNTALINGGGISNHKGSKAKVTNSIFWKNSSQIHNNFGFPLGSANVSYSIIEGGYNPCIDCPSINGNVNPEFKQFNNELGQDSKIRTADDGLDITNQSPANSAADPNLDSPQTDIAGSIRSKPCDIGAYENISKNNSCLISDVCNEITTNQTLFPITDENFNYFCLTGCLKTANPENISLIGCDFSATPTVWYEVKTDENAAQLFTSIESNDGSWTPIWSIFYNNCDSLINASHGVLGQCSNLSNLGLYSIATIDGINTYYIAVTFDQNDPPSKDDSTFLICTGTMNNMITCLGDLDNSFNLDPSVKFRITSREYHFLEPNIDPEIGFLGPFYPGENVEVNINFQYNAVKSYYERIIGFCPNFGPGWDLTNKDFTLYPPKLADGIEAEWHEQGSECAPLVTEHFPFLCTYTDNNGVLHICNELCENCSECQKPFLDPLDSLPSGWFWLSDGNSKCVKGSCKPHERYGIGSTISDVSWVFPLKVKSFNSNEEFKLNKDLQIAFQTFSDGGLGCWEDPVAECLIDYKQFGPKWKATFEPPEITKVVANPEESEICTSDPINIEMMTSDGSDKTIKVFYIDNPSVHGEKEYVFSNGTGIINDTLTISDLDIESPQTIMYYAYVEIPNSSLKIIDTFLVHVYQVPAIEKQNSIPEACVSELPKTLKINGYSSYPGNLLFNWTDEKSGITGSDSLIVIDSSFISGIHKFLITLTDDLGCSVTDSLFYKIKSIDTIVTKSGNILTAWETDAQYQWLNCYSGYAKIIGETNQSFTPITNGSYAVEITKDGCIDTSSCHKVIITGIIENTFGDKLKVYPNPTNGKINIEFEDELNDVEITVSDLKSKEIYRNAWKRMSSTILELDKPAGTYIIQITSGKDHAIVRVVKQR